MNSRKGKQRNKCIKNIIGLKLKLKREKRKKERKGRRKKKCWKKIKENSIILQKANIEVEV